MEAIEELWKKIVSDIKNDDSNGKKPYVTILKSVKTARIEKDELVLEVGSKFELEAIKNYFNDKISDSLKKYAPELTFRLIVNAPVKKEVIPEQQVFPSMVKEEPVKQDNSTQIKQPAKGLRNDSMFNSKYTFDSFVVGESNRYAYTVCQNVSKYPGTRNSFNVPPKASFWDKFQTL